MQLEWDVILTQAVGFLIVLWVLRKYAWGKLLDFMEQRRQTIAGEFEEIERSKVDVEKLRSKFEKELADIEATRRKKIQEAAHEANELAGEIKESARKEAVALRVKTNEDIQLELDKANAALRDQMVGAVITVSEKILREKLDADAHKRLINQFLDEVQISNSQAGGAS